VAAVVWVTGGGNWFLKRNMRKKMKLSFEKNTYPNQWKSLGEQQD